ncbi:MAG: hypothetical protein A3G52_03920 [Candidatus Taylorbacteria bacterium RIFCSPLOWO2_12_FULL_43_20]|uniref:Uncharacterized protein n=1 Tax=Candidatus Taylorbacteria bacterium RIFCSPLOWO2_12_FULL_43_20 TaxID=1802332 RepID=A0A1G2P1U5_9BACT|nr:MAG: hypothetical protein A2825_02205 [Candidatus Taylorbacteria bacterium RIFCSPHIGHO2_01_FULL_43_120]OHA22834.1 MAG: hypothetical protein A3B98_01410 [Candidatus Taylorbacteria bacterium RIFCSPHIGHO2_02_FULL_43_55]OHA29385.1 MAG: hypothetical protein A3E92_02495 [Candidatus Taylorbacteria bacterium RIFCSPHIGHO2_12_FULL_42_34]OHA31761.1 MAG: hypothetical protein A3B09_01935 [Candidatus Taylorbacteria bacterium RIFCSPLOWO2_01_FULL_43_83]OHA38576.1 MAG: hypothetical protein A3H58_00220 [Candi
MTGKREKSSGLQPPPLPLRSKRATEAHGMKGGRRKDTPSSDKHQAPNNKLQKKYQDTNHLLRRSKGGEEGEDGLF